MATLITGAGLVGGHTARLLQQRGESVVLVDVNPDRARLEGIVDMGSAVIERVHVADLPELIRLVRKHGVTRIVHTAALTSDVWVHPHRGVVENVVGLANVLEVARLEGVTRVTMSSSASVYGSGPRTGGAPVAEDAPCVPTDVYGATKLSGEHLGRVYELEFGVEFTVVRYPAVIPPVREGFRTIPNTDIARFGYAVPAMVEAVLRGEEFSALDWPRMEWAYCTDIAAGTVLAATLPAPSRVYNLGAGCTTTLSAVAKALRERIPHARIVVEPAASRSGTPIDPATHALDIGRARAELGYAPALTTVEGLVDSLLDTVRVGA
jgi:nucleoside-diphosphate-sugar epimerase